MGFLILIIAHYLAGNGLLYLFGLKLKQSLHICLSLITGVALLSPVPFLLQLMKVPITLSSVSIGIAVVILLVNIRLLLNFNKITWTKSGFRLIPSFRIYEWPFMLLFAVFVIASVWRAFYMPPSARDMLSGPEAIAEYTVREHTMINSVLSVNLETTNNHLKPPFITGLQIIYKLFGIQFGQLWLSILFISFMVMMYHQLRERLHPILTCGLMLLFFAIPELYGYSYIMLFDYSNMVFFFLGFFFLFRHFDSGERKDFYFSALLFAIATFIRSETLILVAMVVPAYWLFALRTKQRLVSVILQTAALGIMCFLAYYIWIGIFLKYYMPVSFDVGSQVNHHLFDFRPLVTRMVEMNTRLLSGPLGQALWGYFMYVFAALCIAELLILRKVNREARRWWYAILVVYLGLPVIGFLLPLADLMNTTKRGLFKLLPPMMMVMANNGLLKKLSDSITKWEEAVVEEKMRPAAPVKQRPAAKRK